ncbi:MAG: hypothetical protein HDR32_10095 [Treponema sp.]|nr:hypothetical protein [Treponema sp.]
MRDEKITVPLELSADDIRMIADESENAENMEFGAFLGKILKQADEAVHNMGNVIRKINEANPYSKQHKETDR